MLRLARRVLGVHGMTWSNWQKPLTPICHEPTGFFLGGGKAIGHRVLHAG